MIEPERRPVASKCGTPAWLAAIALLSAACAAGVAPGDETATGEEAQGFAHGPPPVHPGPIAIPPPHRPRSPCEPACVWPQVCVPSPDGENPQCECAPCVGGIQNLSTCACNDPSCGKLCHDRGAECGEVGTGKRERCFCGRCRGQKECRDNHCVCEPLTQAKACEDKECGSVDDGCDGKVDCGTCAAPQTCDANACQCAEGFTWSDSERWCVLSLGTFLFNYRDNAGGCGPGGSPYACVDIPPGPLSLEAPAGRYRVRVLDVENATAGGGGLVAWSGDEASGTQYHQSSGVIELEHAFGEITLYYNDWYAFDNDPSATTLASVFLLQPSD